MSKVDLVNELHRDARKKFPRRRTLMVGIGDTLQIDLVDMSSYSKSNKGYCWILVAIDIFSKFVFAEAIKTKRGLDVSIAMKKILKKYQVKNIHSDMGKEFYNKNFQSLMQKYKLNHYSTFSTQKAAIAERFIRTLKKLLWKQFNIQSSYNWVRILKSVIKNYNNTMHSTIKMKPKCVNRDNEMELLTTIYNYKQLPFRTKFHIGDCVRISKYKTVFEKGYTANYSMEVFKVKKIQQTTPVTYILEDMSGSPIKGGFYSNELQKTEFPDTFLIEKVLKGKGDRLFVKWLGYAEKSWIKKSDMIK